MKRYVDDIFVLFGSPHHLEKYNEYLNTKHANIKITSEKEVNSSWPFLDLLISRDKNTCEYKDGLILTCLFRIFSKYFKLSKRCVKEKFFLY